MPCARWSVDRPANGAIVADEATSKGQSWGPLHGVPITIKDAIATAGIRSTGGAAELLKTSRATMPKCVATVKAAGAIVFGKTNVPRWSGDFQTFNEMFGTTNNPWDSRAGCRAARRVARPLPSHAA